MHLLIRSSMLTCTRICYALLTVGLTAFIGIDRSHGQGPSSISGINAGGTSETREREDVSVLQIGRQLESEKRWHEAILYYEKAIRQDVGNAEIVNRLQTARVHFDVVRRYSDRSFIETVKRSTPSEALEVYGEVIAKLEAYFVETVDYSKLALYGTACLEIALTEQDFIDAHLPTVRREAIDAFRRKVHQTVIQRRIASNAELRSVVSQVAVQAQQQIGLLPSATIYELLAGSVCMLDPYSAFLTPGEYREVMSQIEGNLIGLGVELWAEGSELRIVDVFRGSPAYEAGLRGGHFILEVDGNSVRQVGAKKAADMLRGPEGSRVQLVISNGGDESVAIEVIRKRVEIPSVSIAEMRDGGVGYVRITNFQKTTVQEVGRAMFQLSREGMKSLVIDLRRNPGGLLESAVDLADEFLSQGGIVSTRGRNGEENRNYAAKLPGTWDIPLVVLIDGDSASASEIFAGAIRDHNRGYVVGQVSYGKGSVQGVFHNDRGQGGLRLTVSKFYSPSGIAISARGIIPHIFVQEESSNAPQSLTALKPNLDRPKLVAQGLPTQGSGPTLESLTARRPAAEGTNFDSAASGADPIASRDATLEKGLQVAREMLLQARSR
ncbi:MAG: S41 family peptidase [Planctomycetes bacterium]|nr:S41 family peptidase [Planctomycetota bacterium]